MHDLGEWLQFGNAAFDFLGVQEVGAHGQLYEHDEYHRIDLPSEIPAYSDYHVFLFPNMQSHLSLMILIDKITCPVILDTFVGSRVAGVKTSTKFGGTMWFCTLHCPHHDDCEHEFEETLNEIEVFIRQQRGLHVVFGGDFKVQAVRHDARVTLLKAVFAAHGYVMMNSSQDTWIGPRGQREYDCFFGSPEHAEGLLDPELSWKARIVPNAREEVGTDHHLVSLDAPIRISTPSKPKFKHRRGRCGKWQVDRARVAV